MSTVIETVNYESSGLLNLLSKVDMHVYQSLKNTVFPGAKDESIALVLAYCKAQNYDPMKKVCHIVPISVNVGKINKNGFKEDKWEYRDVIMPGIAAYRIDASRTGQYIGISEPEFGPLIEHDFSGNGKIFRFPEWCRRVTKRALPNGMIAEFVAKEYFIENYATQSSSNQEPNKMWRKRPRGQASKCTEAQAIRMGFPDEVGGQITFEEIEGKEHRFTGVVTKEINLLEKNEIIDGDNLKFLRGKIAEAGLEESIICNSLRVSSLDSMNIETFEKVVRKIDKNIEQKKKKELEDEVVKQYFESDVDSQEEEAQNE